MALPSPYGRANVLASARRLSARARSSVVGEAVPALTALGASSLQAAKSALVGTWPSAVVATSETTKISASARGISYCLISLKPYNSSLRLIPSRRGLSITANRVCTGEGVLVVVLDDQLEVRTGVRRGASDAEPGALGFGADCLSHEGLVSLVLCERTLLVPGLADLGTGLAGRDGAKRDDAVGHWSIGSCLSLGSLGIRTV